MVCTGPSSSQRLLVCRLTGDLEFDVNKASMRKDADIFDRAVDQIAAMQSGRGKGMCCQPPLANACFCCACFRGAGKGQGQQLQQQQRVNRQQVQGQGKKKRREHC